ncbi:hypothetical protein E2C01_078325 [Portunus trituberculatus]|uniref:Uncharacterized protein n=1 Tax=Portunus trituberculatus TaxID=210409 RepID=A0A5B7IIF7_PORTR|nr:hypothetical protein [Portunus trituberculatus]
MWAFHGNFWAKGDTFYGTSYLRAPRMRKPNLHSDRGQDSSPCTWRPLGPQSTHGSTVPPPVIKLEDSKVALFSFSFVNCFESYNSHCLLFPYLSLIITFSIYHRQLSN